MMSADSNDLTLDVNMLAVQERFLEEWRAGLRPRLSVYARRYPAYAEALADLVASLPPDAQAETEEASPESFPERHSLGEGVTRALTELFGAAGPSHDAEQAPRVAEERSAYSTGQPTSASTPEDGQGERG